MKKGTRFVGLDVNAETISVAVAEPGGEVRSLGTIPNRPEHVRRLVKAVGPAMDRAGATSRRGTRSSRARTRDLDLLGHRFMTGDHRDVTAGALPSSAPAERELFDFSTLPLPQ